MRLVLLLLSLNLCSGAFALGLGELRTQSFLGQTLQAEIELTSPGDVRAESLRVELAPAAIFAQAGIVRTSVHGLLRFESVTDTRGRPVIRVTSSQPVREPLLSFIVELSAPGIRIQREYGLLLDPHVDLRPRLAVVTPGAPAALPAPSTSEVLRPTPAPPVVVVEQEQAPFVTVRPGDNLGVLARRHSPGGGVTRAQMAWALFVANPDAFVNADINRLKARVRIRIPDREEAMRISSADASAWLSSGGKVAVAVATPTPEPAPETAPVTTAEAEPAPPAAVEAPVQDADAATAAPVEGGLVLRPAPFDALLPQSDAAAEAEAESAAEPPPAWGLTLLGADEEDALPPEQRPRMVIPEDASPDELMRTLQQVQEVSARLKAVSDELAERLRIAEAEIADLTAQRTAMEEAAALVAATVGAGSAAVGGGGVTPGATAAEPTADTVIAAVQPQTSMAPVRIDAVPPLPVAPSLATFTLDEGLLILRSTPLWQFAALAGGLLLLMLLLITRRRQAVDALDVPLVRRAVPQGEAETTEAQARPATWSTPDWLDDAAADASPPVAEDFSESHIDEVLAAAELCARRGYYEVAETMLTDLVEAHPERADFRIKLLRILHVGDRKQQFMQQANELRRTVGEQDERWQETCELGRDLMPTKPMFQPDAPGRRSDETRPLDKPPTGE